jgi:hypothetical protein
VDLACMGEEDGEVSAGLAGARRWVRDADVALLSPAGRGVRRFKLGRVFCATGEP